MAAVDCFYYVTGSVKTARTGSSFFVTNKNIHNCQKMQPWVDYLCWLLISSLVPDGALVSDWLNTSVWLYSSLSHLPQTFFHKPRACHPDPHHPHLIELTWYYHLGPTLVENYLKQQETYFLAHVRLASLITHIRDVLRFMMDSWVI